MRSLLALTLMLVAAPVPALGQSAAQAGLAPALDSLVAPFRALDVFEGVIVIAEGGEVVAERAYGMASREHGIENDVGATFRIASISKSFTRALVGRLMERGTVGVDDAIVRWLPDFPSADRITIRMLLDHRAGVRSWNSVPWDEEALAQATLSDLVDSIARMPLDFEPGTDVSYSNGGYAVLARVLELADGRTYGEMLDAEIVRPLGLRATRHEADGDIIPNLSAGYMPSPSEPGVVVRAPFQSMNTKAGGGSLVSDAADLIAWTRAIRRDPILSQATWDTLFPQRERIAYQGRAPGYNAIVMHDVATDRTVVVLANNYAAGMVADLAQAALDLAAGEEPTRLPVRAPVSVATSDLPFLEGSFRLPEGFAPGDPPLTIEERRGHLHVSIAGAPIDVLVPQGGRTFLSRALWSIVTFSGAPGVETTGMEVRALYNDSRFEAPRLP